MFTYIIYIHVQYLLIYVSLSRYLAEHGPHDPAVTAPLQAAFDRLKMGAEVPRRAAPSALVEKVGLFLGMGLGSPQYQKMC